MSSDDVSAGLNLALCQFVVLPVSCWQLPVMQWAMVHHSDYVQKAKKSAGDGEEEEEEAEQDEDDEKPLLAMVSMTQSAHLCMHCHLAYTFCRTDTYSCAVESCHSTLFYSCFSVYHWAVGACTFVVSCTAHELLIASRSYATQTDVCAACMDIKAHCTAFWTLAMLCSTFPQSLVVWCKLYW